MLFSCSSGGEFTSENMLGLRKPAPIVFTPGVALRQRRATVGCLRGSVDRDRSLSDIHDALRIFESVAIVLCRRECAGACCRGRHAIACATSLRLDRAFADPPEMGDPIT